MPKKLKFEQALSRLADIVDIIEDGDTPLDDAVKLYKEGLGLAQNCGDILGRYESEVLLLEKDASGAFALTPFCDEVKTHA